MATIVKMPKHGNSVEECLLVEWLVKEGDKVKVGDVICNIETDKAAFEVEATVDGIITQILYKAGEIVPVLENIAVINENNKQQETIVENMLECNKKTSEKNIIKISPRARKLANKLGVNIDGLVGSGPENRIISTDIQNTVNKGVRFTSLAKDLAKDIGKNILKGTGLGGMVRAKDVLNLNQEIANESIVNTISDKKENIKIIPVKGIRKIIADRMIQSLQQHAQLTLNTSANASSLLAYSYAHKKYATELGLRKITLNDMITWLTIKVLKEFPELNANLDIEKAELKLYSEIHLGMAIDTNRGLMVPVIKNTEKMSLVDISQSIAKYAESCRNGSVSPDDLTGGTFTISNLGSLGIESFTPILNSPQVAILGICAIKNYTTVNDKNNVVLQPRIGLSLTIDHQVVDGAPAARFLKTLVEKIESFSEIMSLYGAMLK